MDLKDLIAQIQSQLEELADREALNRTEQEITTQRIQTLEQELQEQYHHQSKLDDEAIQMYCQGEYLKTKLEKLTKIAALSQEFRDLRAECQDNQELLETLYASISRLEEEESIHIDPQTILNNDRQPIDDDSVGQKQQISDRSPHATIVDRSQKKEETAQKQNNRQKNHKYEPKTLTLQHIKTALPNAELIYKQLIAHNLEKYQTYHNLIIDELDVIWCSVAFIAFGRIAYRQLSFKHHPDLNGSQEAMQLINTAWEISEEYLANTVNSHK